jgi:hypothetical protein
MLNAESMKLLEFSIHFSIQHSTFSIAVIDLTPARRIRQRTGVLFGAVMIGHLILISAQVQSKAGVPVLEGVDVRCVFRVRAARRTVSAASAARGELRRPPRRLGENERCDKQVPTLEVRLQEQRALAHASRAAAGAARTSSEHGAPDARGRGHRGNPNPGLMTVTIEPRQPRRRAGRHGGDCAQGRRRPRRRASRGHAARVQLIIDRNAAAGAVTERARAGGMVVGVDGDPPLAMDLVSNLADIMPRRCRRGVGRRRHLSEGFVIGPSRSQTRAELYRMITVRPAVDFSRSRTCSIVLVPRAAACRTTGSREVRPRKK